MDEGRQRWWMLGVLFAACIALGFQFQTMRSVAGLAVTELRLDFTEIGSLIGFFLAPGLVLSFPAGIAGRYASDRALATLGLAAMAVGGGVASLAEGFGLLAVGRLLCGAGFVVSNIYFTKMIADGFAGRELATAMAVIVMSWPLGIAMGQVFHGWLAVGAGWQAPFHVASLYCLAGAALVLIAFRPPPATAGAAATAATPLTRREWTLILLASTVWAAFNAGYVVYLSYGPLVLVAGGLGIVQAASVISLASWAMIVSGTICGQIADRTGRADAILAICLCAAMASLALLPQVAWSVPVSLAFGLIGAAPAGLIMALTGQAMAPEKRAFGMGVFFSWYYLVKAPAPALAAWLYGGSGDPFLPILFGILMFALTLAAHVGFRVVQRSA